MDQSLIESPISMMPSQSRNELLLEFVEVEASHTFLEGRGCCGGTGQESLMTFPLTTQTITQRDKNEISGQTVGK